MEEFYYRKLNKNGQAVYHAMYEGMRDIAKEILIPRATPKELSDIFMMMRLDHPELFWAVNFKYMSYADSPNLILVPEYLFEKAKIREHQKALQARVERIAKNAPQKVSQPGGGNGNRGNGGGRNRGGNSPANSLEWEREKYIHDFICENVHYDKLKKSYSHEIIGPLGQGVGVCEGIAKSVKILCDALGIWCIIALCDNNPEKGIKYRHTWNIVRINGTYYHLDATFDNSLTRGLRAAVPEADIRYDYFNIDDKALFRDHEPHLYPAPACGDHDHFFYKEKKLSFTKMEDVFKRCEQAAKKGRVLTFHWRGGYLTRDVLNEILEQMREAGNKHGKRMRISLNWPQAVITVIYSETADESVEMQEANEGEQE